MKCFFTFLTLLLLGIAGNARLTYHCYSVADTTLAWKPADFMITVNENTHTITIKGVTYFRKPAKRQRRIKGYLLTRKP